MHFFTPKMNFLRKRIDSYEKKIMENFSFVMRLWKIFPRMQTHEYFIFPSLLEQRNSLMRYMRETLWWLNNPSTRWHRLNSALILSNYLYAWGEYDWSTLR